MEVARVPPGSGRAPAATGGEEPLAGLVFCPVARALDLIGERWTLVLVRHLLGGPRGFQELRSRTGIAPRVLSTRLRQLIERDFVEAVEVGSRSLYGLTESGRKLEPIVREIGRWWVLNAMEQTTAFGFNAETPGAIVESLPLMFREDRGQGVQLTYEIRLTGEGGGVWTVEIDDGVCRVRQGFASRADVHYTADARDWCRLVFQLDDARGAAADGRLVKDGEGGSIAWYFHLPAPPEAHSKQTPERSSPDGDPGGPSEGST